MPIYKYEKSEVVTEGILSAVGGFVLTSIAIPLAIISIGSGISSITNNNDKKRIEKAIDALKKDPDVKKAVSDLKPAEIISSGELSKKMELDDENAKLLRYNNTRCAVICNKHGNIIACALYTSKEYGYYISDKEYDNGDIAIYIRACLEYKLGIYGEAIKKLEVKIKGNYGKYRDMMSMSGDGMSDDELKELHQNMKIIDNFVKKLYKEIISNFCADKFEYIDMSNGGPIDGKLYSQRIDCSMDDENNKYSDVDLFNFIKNKTDSFAKFNKYDVEEDEENCDEYMQYRYVKSERLPYTNINIFYDVEGGVSIVVTLTRNPNLKFKESTNIFESVQFI